MAIAVRRMFVSPGGNKWGAYGGWSRAREYKEGRGRQDFISPARPPAQTQSILAFATQPNHPGTMLGFSKVLSLAAVALAAAHGAYAQARTLVPRSIPLLPSAARRLTRAVRCSERHGDVHVH